jgi:hypothetical protein
MFYSSLTTKKKKEGADEVNTRCYLLDDNDIKGI